MAKKLRRVRMTLDIDHATTLAGLVSDKSRAHEKAGEYGCAAYHARIAAQLWEASGCASLAASWNEDLARLHNLMGRAA